MSPRPQPHARSVWLVTVLLAAACASSGGTQAAPAVTPAPASNAQTKELEAIYQARTDSARRRFTDADVHFFTGMISHHAQALVMAALIPSHGASPALRTLGARIINAQRDEIALMQRWLRDRGQPVPTYQIQGITLTIHGADHVMPMPGMLTQAQLEELDRARGVEFDRLFLKYMIQHHQGAVTMVDELFGTDGAAQGAAVFKLASDIQVDQRTEIARMRQLLETL